MTGADLTQAATTTDGLVAFLLARIAEDEAGARKATGEHWRWVDPGGDVKQALVTDGWNPQADWTVLPVAQGDAYPLRTDATHIARWDPARVLAESAAKRRIVAQHPYAGLLSAPEACGRCATNPPAACPTLRLLALPFADHPDYQQEWKP